MEETARRGVLYRERRRRKPLFFLRCRLSSGSTGGAPKRDENSGVLLVRFLEVSLPAYPFAHILLTLVAVIHPSLSP